MNFSRNVFLLLFLTFSTTLLRAQIGGLSGSKLGSFTVDVVDHKKVEFEPGFFHARSNRYWDKDSKLVDMYSTSDSLKVVTGMYFRFTYGLWDKMEIGASISTDVSNISVAIRYAFLQREKYGLAAIAGVNAPLGNRTIDQAIRATGYIPQAGLGLVSSFSFSENFSLDFTGQFVHFLEETADKDKGGLFLNMDAGYYILNHQLQFIGGMAYRYVRNNQGGHQVLSFIPGITVETGRNYILVFAVPFDVTGKLESKNLGFSFALTLTFD